MTELLKWEALLDTKHTKAEELFEKVFYPWEVLPLINEFVVKLGDQLDEQEFLKTGEDIWISKTAKVAQSASLTGPLIVGHNAQIRHCAYIRGGVLIGDDVVVGNSCEIKNSILFDKVQVPHYNYIGDSVLGYKAHFGAGAITSNLKSDHSLVTVNIEQQKVKTDLIKFGAIVGDNAEIGCNSVLNPGTIIGRGSNIYPLSSVRGYVTPNSIYKSAQEIVEKI